MRNQNESNKTISTSFGTRTENQSQIGFNNNYDPFNNPFNYSYKSPYNNPEVCGYSEMGTNNNLVNLLLTNQHVLDNLQEDISIEDLWVDLIYESINKNILNKLPQKLETVYFYFKLINKISGDQFCYIPQEDSIFMEPILQDEKEEEVAKNNNLYKTYCGHNNKDNVILDFSEIYDMDLRNKKYDDISPQSIINNILNMGTGKLNIISNLNAITKYDYKLTLFIDIYKSDNFKSENTITTTGEADINLSNIPSSTINGILNDAIKIIRNQVIKYIFIDECKFNINIGLRIENNNQENNNDK